MIDTAQMFMLPGISLGLFFSFLLITSDHYHSRSNQLLAAILFLFVLLLLKISAWTVGTILAEFLDCIRIEYLIAVLFYFYICASLKATPHPQISKWLFLPFFALSALYTSAILGEEIMDPIWGEGLEEYEEMEVYFIGLFFLLVTALSLPIIQRSKGPIATKKWLYAMAIVLTLLVIGWLMLDAVEYLFHIDYWDYLTNSMSILLMVVAYFGVQRLNQSAPIHSSKKTAGPNERKTVPTVKKTSLQHFKRIQELMLEQQLFKDPGFNRERLATVLGLSPSTITRVLKENTTKNFNQFIDHYRINLAKNLLVDERFHIYSLEAVGREVGFKSRSNFYATFKKVTGLSPGAYKKKIGLSCIRSNP
ncbi:MAG: helix-turn-helix domain-containing protein [Bacteroidota bacterium]